MDRLRVEEIIKRTDNGYSEPYLCRLSDERNYIVKGRGATPRGLIAEVVCAWLGRRFGLPIPHWAYALVDLPFVEGNPERRLNLGEGWAFASLQASNVVELRYDALYRQDERTLRRIFLFDYWIRNGDRTGSPLGGNSNLFLQPLDSEIVVIDHNLAFDKKYEFGRDATAHICYDAWSREGNMLARSQYLSEMDAAFIDIEMVLETIPQEWIDAAPNAISEMVAVLELKSTDNFWDVLR